MDINTIADFFKLTFPEPQSSLINGILLGIRLDKDSEFYRQVQTVGLLHIVVLSGSNISIMSNFIISITQLLPKFISILIVIVSIFSFVAFVGAEPPIVRASIMAVFTNIGLMTGRKVNALYSLFISAILIALIKFEWIETISFQLSFAATLGVLFFSNLDFKALEKNSSLKTKLIKIIINDLKISFGAQLMITPIILLYFKEINLMGPLSNLIVSWTIPFIMVISVITYLLFNLSPVLYILPKYACFGLVSYMTIMIEFLSKINFMYIKF